MLTTKEKVLDLLEKNRKNILSGEEIAKTLGLSRSAVWKTIESLRKEGYTIDATTNKGYLLSEDSDILSVEGIFSNLVDLPIQREQIHVYKIIDSTNHLAKKMALEEAPQCSVFIAEEQTAGRGRYGRSFFSPKGTGVYMSILLRPTETVNAANLITIAAAAAVCRALSNTYGVNAEIKWVNDIFIGGKKLCGILTEALLDVESGSIEFLVLGIGINVSTHKEDFPLEIQATAGSLTNDSPKNTVAITRNTLVASILRETLLITMNPISEEVIDEYRSRCFILGQSITIMRENKSYVAKAIGINEYGALIIKKKDGTIETLNSGEISIKNNF